MEKKLTDSSRNVQLRTRSISLDARSDWQRTSEFAAFTRETIPQLPPSFGLSLQLHVARRSTGHWTESWELSVVTVSRQLAAWHAQHQPTRTYLCPALIIGRFLTQCAVRHGTVHARP